MRISRFLSLGLVLLTLLPWACTRKSVSFNSNPDQPLSVVAVSDTLTRPADSLGGKPSLNPVRKVVLTAKARAALGFV